MERERERDSCQQDQCSLSKARSGQKSAKFILCCNLAIFYSMAGKGSGSDDTEVNLSEVGIFCCSELGLSAADVSRTVLQSSVDSPIVTVAQWSTTVTVDLQVSQQLETSNFSVVQLPTIVWHGLDVPELLKSAAAMEISAPQTCEGFAASWGNTNKTPVDAGLVVPEFLKSDAPMDVSALHAIEGFSENWGHTGKAPLDAAPWMFGTISSQGPDLSTASDARNPAWRIRREDSVSSYSSDSSEALLSPFQGSS